MIKLRELRGLDIFSIFSDKQLKELAGIMEKKTHKKGEHIYERGNRAKYLFIVTKGRVSLMLLEPGSEVGVAFEHRERGELFGVASFMTPSIHTLTALCMEDTEVLMIDTDKLHELCEADPLLGYKLTKKIVQIYLEHYRKVKIQIYKIMKELSLITARHG